MSRVRRVADRREMERRVDEYITRGYRITSEGETSTRVKEKDWGDAGTHLLVLLLTGWWSFGLLNALYAIYRYVSAEEVLLTVVGDEKSADDEDRVGRKDDGVGDESDEAEGDNDRAVLENAQSSGLDVGAGDGGGALKRADDTADDAKQAGESDGFADEWSAESGTEWVDDGTDDGGTDPDGIAGRTKGRTSTERATGTCSTAGYVVLQLVSLLVTSLVLLTLVAVHVGALGGSAIPLVLLVLAFGVALRYTAVYHTFAKSRYRTITIAVAALGFVGSSALAVGRIISAGSTEEFRAAFREGSISLWSPIQLPEWWIVVFPLVAGVLVLIGTATSWDRSPYPKPSELREVAASPAYYGVFCSFFGIWSVLFAGIALQRVIVFAPLFEELLKFGVALLVGSVLFGRSFTARVGVALVVGSLFGIVEHATTYPSEADSVYLFRTLFHAVTTVLSVGVYTLFESRGNRQLRWIAPAYSILVHFFYNTFVVLAAVLGVVVFGGTNTFVTQAYGGAAILLTTGLFVLAIVSEDYLVALYEPLDHVLSDAV